MSRFSLFALVFVAGVVGVVALYRVKDHTQTTSTTLSPHMQAHQLGAELYKANGISGISQCDTRAEYGCFHGFIGAAIAANGLAVVKDIDTACQKVVGPVGCQHGIGHGLLEYEGYNLKGLASALAQCSTLVDPPPFEGCYAGAFMEYDTQIMLPGGPTARKVQDEDYAYPCDKLDAKFQNACAYSQPHWWGFVLKLQATPADFIRLGDLCRSLKVSDEAKLDCFGGVGVRAGNDQVMFKVASPVADLCDSAGANERERLVCRAMAASYTYITTGKTNTTAACGGLDGEVLAYCQGYATDKTKFAHPTPLPASLGGGFGR